LKCFAYFDRFWYVEEMVKSIHRRNVRFKNYVANTDAKKLLGVALDTSKTFHRVIIFNFLGEILIPPFSVDTLKSGYEEIVKKIGKAKKMIKPERTYIALETPAKYTANLVYHFRKDFKSVVFIPPYEVSQNRKQRTFHGLKNDDIDAGAIGDMLIRGEFTFVHAEKRKYVELKNLVNFREQKIILRTALKNQIEHRFSKIFPGINCDLDGNRKLFSHSWKSYTHLGLLNSGKTPRQILAENEDDLIEKFGYMTKIKLGKRLRELRQKQGLTLQELAKLSGQQISTLSRIEHNKMTGTIATHAKVAYFFDISLSEFYKGIKVESSPIKVPFEENIPEIVTQGDTTSQLLTKNISNKKLLPTLLTIEPEGKTTKEKVKSGSEEFVYALKGSVEITIEDKTYKLSEGNTFYFNANKPHYFENLRKTKAKLICVRTK